MDNDIIARIKMNYNTFSAAKKRIADYVLASPEDVIYKSITEISESMHVGEATVSRFCQDIQCHGYQEFRLELAKNIFSQNGGEEGQDANGIDLEIDNICKKHIAILDETKQLIDRERIRTAAEYMTKANKIVFFGAGMSYVVALQGYMKFIRVTPKVEIGFNDYMQMSMASLLGPDDVGIFVSYSGSTKTIVNMAKCLKQNGAKVICITRFVKSPLTSQSDVTLLFGGDESAVLRDSFVSETSQLLLLGILYSEFCSQNWEEVEANMSKVSNASYDRLY